MKNKTVIIGIIFTIILNIAFLACITAGVLRGFGEPLFTIFITLVIFVYHVDVRIVIGFVVTKFFKQKLNINSKKYLIGTKEYRFLDKLKVKYWKDEEIQEQLSILVDAYIPDESAVMEMALNVENLANQMFLIGEMMARLQEQSNILKADIENKMTNAIYVERSTWERGHDGKAPSIKFFEALACQKVADERTKLAKVDSDLKRFKTAYESIEAKMNATKKKIEVTKFEIGGA